MPTCPRLLLVAGALAALVLSPGCAGKDGKSGGSCTVRDNGDGTSTIRCPDGTSTTVADGAAGSSCSIFDNGDGTRTIRCEDGTTVTVGGTAGAPALVTDLHGAAAVEAADAAARSHALATVTGATADPAGVLSVAFTVTRTSGAPVTDLAAISASVAKLVPRTGGGSATAWVPYVQRQVVVSGSSYPNPDGTEGWQGWAEGNGTLAHLGGGAYTYVFATNLAQATAAGVPVGYRRDLVHRVSITPGAPWTPSADAVLDFVPSGVPTTTRREVVPTAACRACHGPSFSAHAGTSRSVEGCAVCHAEETVDPYGGAALDLRVMIHKIHAGGELPSVAGVDGTPWATADNGSYAIWDSAGVKHEWWKVRFPAVLTTCSACHLSTAADADAWERRPSRAACGACHDTVDFAAVTTTHLGGQQLDDRLCADCHDVGGSRPVGRGHDRSGADPAGELYDPRNVPEFSLDLTLTPPPANGVSYAGNEAPVVRVVMKRNGVPIPDHRLQSGTAQGCTPTGTPLACAPDADGRFSIAYLFVHGPRARRVPVLTTAARAQLLSTSTGPWDLSSPGASLTLKLDQGATVTLPDAWGTRLAGTVTVPVSSGLWAGGPSAATTSEIVAWLNGNAAFAARAIAWNELGKVGIRSRNLGPLAGLQLQAGPVTTAVFGGDTSLRMPSGSTGSNSLLTPLSGFPDPKLTATAEGIEYQLDPVTDLAPGTYVASLEIAQLGRVSATNYRTPSVAKVAFQVKTSTPEPLVADGCAACHQGEGGVGAVLDLPRHFKILDDAATDQCGACHDLQPQLAADGTGQGGWTGARPLAKRVHAVHFGSRLTYPLRTVDYSIGDTTPGRNWDITFPMDVRRCEACHSAATSGSWRRAPGRLACGGCHDGDAAAVHLRLMTEDPTPVDPWSGDEKESCAVCH